MGGTWCCEKLAWRAAPLGVPIGLEGTDFDGTGFCSDVLSLASANTHTTYKAQTLCIELNTHLGTCLCIALRAATQQTRLFNLESDSVFDLI